MVGIVLVSHSRALALGVQELVVAMTGGKLALAVAAGTGESRQELGTDAMEIMEAINTVMSDEGVLVLVDMGSAILSTETALGFLDEPLQAKVRVTPAPFIEGAVAAGVVATLGSSLDEVAREAESALKQKISHLKPVEAEAVEPPGPHADARTVRVVVRNPHGLHARPAAQLIQAAGKFAAAIEVRNLTRQRGPASIKSIIGLATLEALEGDEIELSAHGADADQALSELKAAIESGLGEKLPSSGQAIAPRAAPGQSQEGPRAAGEEARGPSVVAISPGIAIAPLYAGTPGEVTLPTRSAQDPETEIQSLKEALEKARGDLMREASVLKTSVGKNEAAILQAQAAVLDDPTLSASAEKMIRDEKLNAPAAWHRAYEEVARTYEALSDEYLRQRSADVRDVGLRVLAHLGVERHGLADLPQPGILLVDDLAPSDVTGLAKEKVLGVILRQGGKTSHAAILLRARGIPAVARAESELQRADFSQPKGNVTAAIDGDLGKLWLNPDAAITKFLHEQLATREAAEREEATHRSEPAVTRDGRRVGIWANLGQPTEAVSAVEAGAEGAGLFRTEFLFLHRKQAPTEEEQFQALSQVKQAMGDRPVIIRTLDIGGDKQLSYLPLPPEENPFLGVRGVRLCLAHPELFTPHLRAILRAAADSNLRLMFPMIADPTELAQARAALEAAHQSLTTENIPHAWPLPAGIMIEVPSAVGLIDQFAPLVDFFSIGTNDLTQYVLAADRGNTELGHFQDALHPAVLREIQRVVTGAHRLGKEVGICGEAAADPEAAQIFIGLGVDELSVTPARVPKLKASIRLFSQGDAETLASQALACHNATEVRALFSKSTAG